MILTFLAALVAPPSSPSPIAYPHPLITEVLYHVPQGSEGDANQDGQRSATGDEFVELVNPHDRAIELGGYTITDSVETQLNTSKTTEKASDKSGTKGKDVKKPRTAKRPQISFTFPELKLEPGERVVVFTGYKASFAGPHGTAKAAPARPDPKFGDAYVFNMAAETQFIAFSNEGDAVQLLEPGSEGTRQTVAVVWWGTSGEAVYSGSGLCEEVKEGRGSAHRVGRSRTWSSSEDLSGVLKGTCSPGVVDLDAIPEPEKRERATPRPRK